MEDIYFNLTGELMDLHDEGKILKFNKDNINLLSDKELFDIKK